MNITQLEIPADDGFELSSLLITPSAAPRGVIQFHRGTSTRKEFYLDYCQFLAQRGYAVVLFDYRGVGGSRPCSLRGFNGAFTDWGQRDMVGVLDWVAARFPGLPRYIVAHSMGGQLIGLMRNHYLADGFITICSSYGNWKNYTGANKYKGALFWSTYWPISLKLFGYVPLERLGLGEDLPGKGSWELWSWCIGNRPFSTLLGQQGIKHHYHEIWQPFKAIFLEDDNVATVQTIPNYRRDYHTAQLEVETLNPWQLGVSKIGHYGFFKNQFRETLWSQTADWLAGLEPHGLVGRPTARARARAIL